MSIVRKQTLVVGSQQHGKTFWSEKYLQWYISKKYGNGLVYNFGRDSDYSFAEEIKILSFKEHLERLPKSASKIYMKNPSVSLFAYKNTVYHLEDFNKVFKNKAVRVRRINDRIAERKFFKALFLYVHSTLTCFDDSRTLLRHGLSEELIELFSRRDHSGSLSTKRPRSKSFPNGVNGMDIIFQFHNFDNVNLEFLTYTTDIILFRQTAIPTYKNVENPQLKERLNEITSDLLSGSNKHRCIKISLEPLNYCEQKDVTLKL